jgi:hypothetical protein
MIMSRPTIAQLAGGRSSRRHALNLDTLLVAAPDGFFG